MIGKNIVANISVSECLCMAILTSIMSPFNTTKFYPIIIFNISIFLKPLNYEMFMNLCLDLLSSTNNKLINK